eukprot:5474460-Heterocapsa_arctica.AAC.1
MATVASMMRLARAPLEGWLEWFIRTRVRAREFLPTAFAPSQTRWHAERISGGIYNGGKTEDLKQITTERMHLVILGVLSLEDGRIVCKLSVVGF